MSDIHIEREGESWAVKHKGGYLGFTATREEAQAIATLLESDQEHSRANLTGAHPARPIRSRQGGLMKLHRRWLHGAS